MSALKRLQSSAWSMLAALALVLSLAACQDPGPAEEAGQEIDETVEEMREEGEDAVDEARDAVEEAGDEVEDTLDEVDDDT